MTEKTAKTKWCPESRVGLAEGMAANRTANMDPSGNGYANVYQETRCIGSECMFWREDGRNSNSVPVGHCGLAR